MADRNQKILDVVMAEGTMIQPSKINPGYVTLINGLTGLDYCERTIGACFDSMIEEDEGGMSPGRVAFTMVDGAPHLFVRAQVTASVNER